MRAAFFERAGTITVRDVPVPDPNERDVRLRIRFCGICGSDLSLYKTGALAGPDVVLGHEISATVDVDPSKRWQAGTRVVPFPARGCGECMWCLEGHPRYCVNPPYQEWGGFAEYACYPADGLILIPDDLDDRSAALTEPLGVALRAVEMASPARGDLAYVSGLGSIGLLCVAGLVAEGCRVVGADPREDRRAMGLALGCASVLDPTAEDPIEATWSVDPHGPRISFECSGIPEALQQAIDVCGHLGVIGIVGIPMAPVLLLRMALREQRAFSLSGPSTESMVRAMDLLQERDEIAGVITRTVPLDRVNDAFEALVRGRGDVKILVEPDS
jgi:L-idonate 5-dehydrogenase